MCNVETLLCVFCVTRKNIYSADSETTITWYIKYTVYRCVYVSVKDNHVCLSIVLYNIHLFYLHLLYVLYHI